MASLTVRRNGGEVPRTQPESEPSNWMPWDPFRQMAPFLTAEDQPARFCPDFETEVKVTDKQKA